MNYSTKSKTELIGLLEEQKKEIETLKNSLNKSHPSAKYSLKRERQLQMIARFSLDGIILINEKGNITFWNPVAEQLFGYTEQEALGLNLHQLLAPSKYHKAHFKAFEEFSRNGRSDKCGKILELEAIHKNGREILIELSISKLKVDHYWHALGFIRDITSRKHAEDALFKSEQKYRNLIENINDVIYEIDEEAK
jgi:PAS domain S-box